MKAVFKGIFKVVVSRPCVDKLADPIPIVVRVEESARVHRHYTHVNSTTSRLIRRQRGGRYLSILTIAAYQDGFLRTCKSTSSLSISPRPDPHGQGLMRLYKHLRKRHPNRGINMLRCEEKKLRIPWYCESPER